jgi:putative ATP-dependent endonuclease of OLD family
MKLSALSIKNFGCFDDRGCEIKIDKIVILIGQNNTGKSTILDAYEAFASAGAEQLLCNFHNEDTRNPIQITGIFTEIVAEDTEVLGQKCVHADPTYGECIKVMFQWTDINKKGEKFTFNHISGKFEKGGAGGFDSLIASRVPVPLRIQPTDKYDAIESAITEILTATVKESIKKDKSKVAGILAELETLTAEFADAIDEQLKEATDKISQQLSEVFPGYKAEFQPGIGKIEIEKIIGGGSQIRIKEENKASVPLSQQGSGMQRSFLWSAISTLADLGKMKKGAKKVETTDKSRILLIDEPEAFLHPPTVRAAREALYKLAELTSWQVMATTHSPVFIDISKPHTTIIRVEKDDKWETKIISTDKIVFEADERNVLAMIRACNPMVNEFFFADKVILVEGDTEQLVYTSLLQESVHKDKLHIVSCYGKANIPMFCKILNHFGVTYIAIHDSDCPMAKRKDKWISNAMWTINEKIIDCVAANTKGAIAIVQVPYFEKFYFNEEIKGDKPYSSHQIINSKEFATDAEYAMLRNFYQSVFDGTHSGLYTSMDELVLLVKGFVALANPEPKESWNFNKPN